MVGFKNRYMVVEVNLNLNRDQKTDDPIIITPYNVTKAIKDSILVNFGECGLASMIGSFQGTIFHYPLSVFSITNGKCLIILDF